MRLLAIILCLIMLNGCVHLQVNSTKGDGVADFSVGLDLSQMRQDTVDTVKSMKFWGNSSPSVNYDADY